MTYYTVQDDLTQQSSQGTFSQSGRMDILATAIGKPDNPGQVRGESRGTSLGKYFGRSSKHFTEAQVQSRIEEMQQSLRAEFEAQQRMMAEKQEQRDAVLRAEIKAEMRDEILALLKSGKLIDELKNIESPIFPSSKDSNNVPDTVVLGDPSPKSPTEEL